MLHAIQKAFIQHRLVVEWDVPAAREAMRSGDLMSDQQFADFVGVHANTLLLWKKNPEWQAAYKKARERIENSNDFFLECMKYRADEELWKNYLSAKGAEKRQYLTMVFRRTENVGNGGDVVDYGDLSDDELTDLCIKREVAPVGLSLTELQALAKQRKGD
jgi:hypothetical protein